MAQNLRAPFKHAFHASLVPTHPSCQCELDVTAGWGDLSASSRPRQRLPLARLSQQAAEELLDGAPTDPITRILTPRVTGSLLWGIEGLGLDGERVYAWKWALD